MNRARRTSQYAQRRNDVYESQPGSSSQANPQDSNRSSTRKRPLQNSQNVSSQNISSQNLRMQEKMQIVSGVIKYLLTADRNKHPILKAHIMKNTQCNAKEFHLIMKEVEILLFSVFGYRLIQVEGTKYIMVNEVNNHLPHLNFKKSSSTQTLLFLVLVHIFMLGDSSKEEILWDFLRNLGIITQDNYTHEYFGDVKQLVTVDLVNQRYLEKIIPDKDDPTKLEYKWGSRALNEITFRSALEFVATVYDMSPNKWKLQHKAVKEQERLTGREQT